MIAVDGAGRWCVNREKDRGWEVSDGNDNDNNTCDAQQHEHWRTESGSCEFSGSRNEGQRLGARGSWTSKVQGDESELLMSVEGRAVAQRNCGEVRNRKKE